MGERMCNCGLRPIGERYLVATCDLSLSLKCMGSNKNINNIVVEPLCTERCSFRKWKERSLFSWARQNCQIHTLHGNRKPPLYC